MQTTLRGIATDSKLEGISEVHSLNIHGDAFVATGATYSSFWTPDNLTPASAKKY